MARISSSAETRQRASPAASGAAAGLTAPDWRSGRPAGCGLRRGLLSSVTHLMTRRFARAAHGHAPRSGTPWISGWRGVIEPQTACLAVVPTVRSQFLWVKGQARPPGACSGWGVRPAAGEAPPRVCSHQASAQGTFPVPWGGRQGSLPGRCRAHGDVLCGQQDGESVARSLGLQGGLPSLFLGATPGAPPFEEPSIH